MKSNDESFCETSTHHDFRHLWLTLALILFGVYCSVFKIPVFDKTWNFFTTYGTLIIAGVSILFLLALGGVKDIFPRTTSYIVITKRWIWNLFFSLLIPFIAYRIIESADLIDKVGLSITLIILAWAFALFGPLSKRYRHKISCVDDDQLERQMYVESFTNFITNNLDHPSTQFSRIAITASWGIGKTDFILRVINELNKRNKANKTKLKFRTHLLCPWQAKTETDAHEQIIQGIDKALGFWSPAPSSSSKIALSLLALLGIKSPAKQISDLLSSSDVMLTNIKLYQIDQWLKHSNQRVVIFVDDMERAGKKQIRKIFPALNQLKRLNYCCFVFAIDPERLQSSFSSNEEAKGYINKIFDYNLPLPAPENREIIKLAKVEVVNESHPFLYRSLELLEPIFPKTPRALKQWLATCK